MSRGSHANRALAATSPLREALLRFASAFNKNYGLHFGLFVALLILIAVFGTLRGEIFFLPRNLLNIVNSVTLLGLLAMMMTVLLVGGTIDISVGSIVGLCSITTAAGLALVDNPALGFVTALVVGALAGLINGFLVTYGRVNPIIATLGTLSAFRGLAYIVSNGKSIGVVNPGFTWIGSERVFDVPAPTVIFAVAAVLFLLFMRHSRAARHIYGMGGNMEAAILAGINVTRYRFGMYMFSGLACGLAAILLTARSHSGQPASGSQGLELDAITAAFLGGCGLRGGTGSIFGTLLGVVIIGTLNNGLILLGVPTFYQFLAKGTLLLVAVMIQEFRRSGPRPMY